jgi:hypothetical protein
MEFAKSSSSIERYPITENNCMDMFNFIRSKGKE